MFLIILLLAIAVILTVVSIIGAIYFFYKKKIKLGLISIGSLVGFILLIIFLCNFYAFRAPGYIEEKQSGDIESTIVID